MTDQKNRKNKLRILNCLLSFFVLLTTFFPSAVVNANTHQALIDSRITNLIVVNEDTLISNKYTFFPEFIRNTTTVEVFGNANWQLKWSPSENEDFWAFIPTSDSQKGNIGVTYRRVGMFNDRWVDLRITVEDWDSFANNKGNIAYSNESIRHATQAYNSVTQTWEFIDHETGKSVSVDGYLTLADVDVRQGISFSDSQLRAFDNLYATNHRWLKYQLENGMHSIYDSTNANVSSIGLPADHSLREQFPYNHDKYTHLTATFSNTSRITFDWTRAFIGTWDNPTNNPNFNQITDAQVFFLISQKLAKTEPLEPEKFVRINDELVTEHTLTSYEEEFTYEIYHQVHNEFDEFFYSKYEIKDVVPKGLTVQSVGIYDQNNRDVSNRFYNRNDGNTIHFEATQGALANSSFYDNTYRVVITVSPDNTNEQNAGGIIEWINTATVVVNDIEKESNDVITKLNSQVLTINHIDQRTGELILTETETKLRGESYHFSSRDDLTKEDYTYRFVESSGNGSGVVGTEDIEINFYYTIPLIEAALEKIQIFTAPADEGLPVNIDLSKVNIYEESLSDMENAKIYLSLYHEDTLIEKREYTAKSLPNNVEMLIPPEHLKVNEHKSYTIKLEGYSEDDISIVEYAREIMTDGYTSAEETLKFDASNDDEIIYKGVVMTEREARKDKEMQVYYETINIPLSSIKNMRTGYGFEMPVDITYTNEIGKNHANFGFEMLVPRDTVDNENGYIEYEESKGLAVVPLERTKQETKTDDDVLTSIQKFELPQVYVERITGNLFSEEQLDNNDSKIKNQMIDGGRKFYLPIWGHVGDYDVKLSSSKEMGINKVNMEVTDALHIFAHMYAHMDSETIEYDAILLEPMNSNNPFPNGVPDSWTDEEVQALQDMLAN